MGFFHRPVGGNGGGGTPSGGSIVANYSKNIAVNEWALVSGGDYSGLYKVTITHNLNSTNLIMAIYENGIECILDDREKISIGAKMKDCKVLGTPYMVVLGDKLDGENLELEEIT